MGYENTLQEVMPHNISNSDLKRNFADLHDALRSGRHIQASDGIWFEILRKKENFESLRKFYEEIYLVDLKEDVKGYFYIDFFEGSKGKLSNTIYSHNVIKKLDGWQHLVGVMLLKMFYEKWYDNDKTISWEDIYVEIIDKEYYAQYQRILFGKNRSRAENLDENEIEFASNKFFRAITDFDRLGWVKILVPKSEKENWQFRINVSIHRFAELHQRDLDDIDTLTENAINKINTGKL